MKRLFVLSAASLLALAACSGDTSTTLRPPLSGLAIVSGDGQSAAQGTDLPEPLVVHAVRSDGSFFWDTQIHVTVASGNGLAARAEGGGSVSGNGSTLMSAGAGKATIRWGMGGADEAQRLRIWTVSASLVDTFSVEATATSLPPPEGG